VVFSHVASKPKTQGLKPNVHLLTNTGTRPFGGQNIYTFGFKPCVFGLLAG
jgi:hypothetical protein